MVRYQKNTYHNISDLSEDTKNNLEQILAAEYAGRYSIECSDFGDVVKINTTNAKWQSLVQRAEEMTHGEPGRYVWIREIRETKVWVPEETDKAACRKAVKKAKDGGIAFPDAAQYEVRMSKETSWTPEDCIDFYVH